LSTRIAVGAAGLISYLGLVACQVGANDGTGGGTGGATARSQLSQLAEQKSLSMAGYSRDRFPHWISQGNDCDTRDVVLERQGTNVVTSANCMITSGEWRSPYDGKSTSDPQDLDIDHVVPLAAAWRSGASKWTDAKRSQFANDLTRPQLLAVTASVNRAKGDQDPSTWKPPLRSFWCAYATDWIAVKAFWGLSVTTAEKGALTDMLNTCQT